MKPRGETWQGLKPRDYRADEYGNPKPIRRRTYRKVKGAIRFEVQTYRAWLTLECGHPHTFTVSATTRAKPGYRPSGKFDCWRCWYSTDKNSEDKP